jgi:hypothetical protein
LTRVGSHGRLPTSCHDLNVPRELARHDVVLEGTLGKGEFGEVRRGRLSTVIGRVRTSVLVAVKMAQTEELPKLPTVAAESLFLAECAVTWQFYHENVVSMYGVVTAGTPCVLYPPTRGVCNLSAPFCTLFGSPISLPNPRLTGDTLAWCECEGTCWCWSCAKLVGCTTGSERQPAHRLILVYWSGSYRMSPKEWRICLRGSLFIAISHHGTCC